MAKRYFVPRADGALMSWLRVFRNKIAALAATFGFTPAEITDMQTACDDYVNRINDVAQAKIAYKKAVSEKKAQRKKSLRILTRYINFLKAHKNYADNIGIGLGVVGPEAVFEKDKYRPKLKGFATAGYIRINYNKEKTDGINMWSKLEDEGDDKWVMIGFDAHPPFFDKRPLAVPMHPEARQYKAMGVLNDQRIGQWSGIITVLFNGGA